MASKKMWRTPRLKKSYDVVIIGAGGQELATAYYLAKKHGVRNIAVLEKGWLGGGNTGRNTQITRSNYFWPQSAAFFDHSLKLYEDLRERLYGERAQWNLANLLAAGWVVSTRDFPDEVLEALRNRGVVLERAHEGDGGVVYRNLTAQPRAWLVGDFELERPGEAVKILRSLANAAIDKGRLEALLERAKEIEAGDRSEPTPPRVD